MHAVCYKSRQISSNFTLHHSKLCSWEVSTLVTCFSFVFDVRRYVRISLPRRKQWWMTLWKSSKPCEAIVEEGNSKLAVSLMDNVWAPSCYGWKQSVVWKFCLKKGTSQYHKTRYIYLSSPKLIFQIAAEHVFLIRCVKHVCCIVLKSLPRLFWHKVQHVDLVFVIGLRSWRPLILAWS